MGAIVVRHVAGQPRHRLDLGCQEVEQFALHDLDALRQVIPTRKGRRFGINRTGSEPFVEPTLGSDYLSRSVEQMAVEEVLARVSEE